MRLAAVAATFVLTFALRVWDVQSTFWMAEEQMRDWTLALTTTRDVFLAGPFYWILWLFRITVGPLFENLPHAGAIGQGILQSAADAALLLAVWRRSQSLVVAIAAVTLVAVVSYDLMLSATISPLVVGSALVKIAVAMILFEVPSSRSGVIATAAIAWSAVLSFSGNIYVVIAILAMIAGASTRNLWTIAVSIAVLQIPHALHRGPALPGANADFANAGLWLFVWSATLSGVLMLRWSGTRRVVGPAIVLAAITLVPARIAFAPPMRRMPQYATLVEGSRRMARIAQPLREIRTRFDLPPASRSDFLYLALGRRLDPASSWVGVIDSDGSVSYTVSPAQ
jgi:hypothetical protein